MERTRVRREGGRTRTARRLDVPPPLLASPSGSNRGKEWWVSEELELACARAGRGIRLAIWGLGALGTAAASSAAREHEAMVAGLQRFVTRE